MKELLIVYKRSNLDSTQVDHVKPKVTHESRVFEFEWKLCTKDCRNLHQEILKIKNLESSKTT